MALTRPRPPHRGLPSWRQACDLPVSLRRRSRPISLALLVALAAAVPMARAQPAQPADPALTVNQPLTADQARRVIGLITRSEQTNPYFAALRRGAEQAAAGLNVRLISASGEAEDSSGGQIAALDKLVASGVRAILITPADSRAIVPAIARARARGVLVIALDGPTEPAAAVDAVIATDNLEAGALAGRYARALWEAGHSPRPPRLALLDLPAVSAAGAERRQGFLAGFGRISAAAAGPATAADPAGVVCRAATGGDRISAKVAMEGCLARGPIDLVFAANEPAAAGAVIALATAGLTTKVPVVTVDGSCLGVRAVADGYLSATAQQFPGRMGEAGVAAAATWLRKGQRPDPRLDTGVSLVAARPLNGVPSIDLQAGLAACWGGDSDLSKGIRAYAYPVTRQAVAQVQAAVAAIAARGEAALAELQRPAGAGPDPTPAGPLGASPRVANLNGADYGSLFVLDGRGESLLLPSGSGPAGAASLPSRQPLLEIGDSPAARGWWHDRLIQPAGTPPLWRSTYVERVSIPGGRTLLVGRSLVDSPIENAFVVQQVKDAVALIARQGRAAFPALRDRQGRFVFRDVYVFVLDANGVELVNPFFPALEGRNLIGLQDGEGKEVIRDELLLALRQGSGWTAALWPDPRTGQPRRKLSYVSRVTTPQGETLVVGAGVNESSVAPLPAGSLPAAQLPAAPGR
jgi:fructose transport system substrate-binding protein